MHNIRDELYADSEKPSHEQVMKALKSFCWYSKDIDKEKPYYVHSHTTLREKLCNMTYLPGVINNPAENEHVQRQLEFIKQVENKFPDLLHLDRAKRRKNISEEELNLIVDFIYNLFLQEVAEFNFDILRLCKFKKK